MNSQQARSAPGSRSNDLVRAPRRVQAVLHAIDVLEAITTAGREIGVSDLARRTGLNKATVYNILMTLEERHLVARAPGAPLYRLSWGLYQLGAAVVRDSDLSWAAKPFLNLLAESAGETVLLGIFDDGSVLHIDRAESPSGLRMVANIGRRSPLHATGSGKVLLAWQPEPVVRKILNGTLRRFTSNTITDPDTLERQLEQARVCGYATNWQEVEVGLCSLAVPLRDYTGGVVGALTLAGPAQRLTARSVKRLLGPLQAAAAQIEERLGADVAVRGAVR